MHKKLLRKIFGYTLDFLTGFYFFLFRKKVCKDFENNFRSFGVEDTNVCNARCSFCGYRSGYDKRSKGFVSEKVLTRCLELFRKWGGKNFSFISILGDPFTDKDIVDKIKMIAAEPGVEEINIYSNLIGLDNYDMDAFVTSGITILSVSTCLGGREMYKRLFGVDEYEHVVSNILRLLEANKRHGNPLDITLLIRMDYPVKNNFDKDVLEKIKEYLPENKLDILPNNLWDNYNGTVKLEDLPAGAVFRKNIETKKIPCYALYRKIQVLYNGDIAVCSCRVSPALVVDNIFNYDNLNEYWHGEKLKIFRENWISGNVPEVCKDCTHYLPLNFIVKLEIKEKMRHALKKLIKAV